VYRRGSYPENLLACNFKDHCRTHDSATRSLSGVIICPVCRARIPRGPARMEDSGYKANSIAFLNSTTVPETPSTRKRLTVRQMVTRHRNPSGTINTLRKTQKSCHSESRHSLRSLSFSSLWTAEKVLAPFGIATTEFFQQPLKYASRSGVSVPALQSDVAAARYDEKFARKKNGCGTARTDTWEISEGGKARPWSRPRARWKCAANPYFRTSRNAR
jgi:hypothetical protein